MNIHDLLHRREHRLVLFFQSIVRYAFFCALILTPILYLPWSSDVLEVNKQALLVLCSIIGVIAWILSLLTRKALIIKTSWVYWILFVLGLSVLFSTIFSLAPFTSWFGGDQQEYSSLVTWLSCIALFFVGVQVIEEEGKERIIDCLIVPGAIIILVNCLGFFGLSLFENNFIGSPNALGLYSIILASLVVGKWFFSKISDSKIRGFNKIVINTSSAIVLIGSLLILWVLDFWLLWALLCINIFWFFIVSFVRKSWSTGFGFKHIVCVILLVLSFVFIFVQTPGDISFNPEIAPTHSASWDIAKSTFSSKSALFGSGPGTFEIDFQLYKPLLLNNTQLWDISFNRASSYWLTLLTTTGWMTFSLYLLFIIVTFFSSAFYLSRNSGKEHLNSFLIFTSWFGLFVAQGFYSSNMTLVVLFWLLSALLWAMILPNASIKDIEKTPVKMFISTIILVLCAFAILVSAFVMTSRYFADIAFAKAISHSESGESVDLVIDDLVVATTLNRWSDVYARNLAYALLYKAGQMISDTSINPEQVSGYISESINMAQKAVQLSPNVIANHVMLGDIYREVASTVSGADSFAIIVYENALSLAPTNPKYLVSLGRAYLIRADILSILATSDDSSTAEESSTNKALAIEGAIDSFNKALELKSDYIDAQYYLALAYERQGNLSEAIARLSSLQSQNPYDASLALQIGLLYLQQGKLDDAQVALEYVVDLSPDYSNARWFLSSVYEQQGNIESAIIEVEKVLELNPDNELIISRLERLRDGLVSEEELELLDGENEIADIQIQE